MMWSTFIVKRFSAAAFLMEKVGHAQEVHPESLLWEAMYEM